MSKSTGRREKLDVPTLTPKGVLKLQEELEDGDEKYIKAFLKDGKLKHLADNIDEFMEEYGNNISSSALEKILGTGRWLIYGKVKSKKKGEKIGKYAKDMIKELKSVIENYKSQDEVGKEAEVAGVERKTPNISAKEFDTLSPKLMKNKENIEEKAKKFYNKIFGGEEVDEEGLAKYLGKEGLAIYNKSNRDAMKFIKLISENLVKSIGEAPKFKSKEQYDADNYEYMISAMKDLAKTYPETLLRYLSYWLGGKVTKKRSVKKETKKRKKEESEEEEEEREEGPIDIGSLLRHLAKSLLPVENVDYNVSVKRAPSIWYIHKLLDYMVKADHKVRNQLETESEKESFDRANKESDELLDKKSVQEVLDLKDLKDIMGKRKKLVKDEDLINFFNALRRLVKAKSGAEKYYSTVKSGGRAKKLTGTGISKTSTGKISAKTFENEPKLRSAGLDKVKKEFALNDLPEKDQLFSYSLIIESLRIADLEKSMGTMKEQFDDLDGKSRKHVIEKIKDFLLPVDSSKISENSSKDKIIDAIKASDAKMRFLRYLTINNKLNDFSREDLLGGKMEAKALSEKQSEIAEEYMKGKVKSFSKAGFIDFLNGEGKKEYEIKPRKSSGRKSSGRKKKSTESEGESSEEEKEMKIKKVITPKISPKKQSPKFTVKKVEEEAPPEEEESKSPWKKRSPKYEEKVKSPWKKTSPKYRL